VQVMNHPIVVLGMHRSGTTLLVKLMQELGYFAGWRMGKNREAFFYQRWNEWLMRRAGGAWDYPEPLLALYERCPVSERHLESLVDDIRQSISGIGYLEFSGRRGPGNLQRTPWGWKDPRTAFVLPIWQKIYPNLRVINIIRNGVDVALSLNERARRGVGKTYADPFQRIPWKLAVKNFLLPRESYILASLRCGNLKESYRLWEEYVTQGEQVCATLPSDRVLQVRYEDFLGSPVKTLSNISAFCGLEVDDARLDLMMGKVDVSRKFAFSTNGNGVRLYEEVADSPLMQRYGYGDIQY